MSARQIEGMTEKLAGVDINSEGDLTLRFYTTKNLRENQAFKLASNGESIPGKITMTVKVSRQVLMDNFEYFRIMFTANRWAEYDQRVFDTEYENPLAMNLWFRVYHGGELPELRYRMPARGVWEVIQTGGFLQAEHNDNIDLARLKLWFARVYDYHKLSSQKHYKYNEDAIRAFLYPCYDFDDATGFAAFTKLLAYNFAGHITEFNPTNDYQNALHLHPIVMAGVNGARGSLRTQLISGFFDPMDDFLDLPCQCSSNSLKAYTKTLRKMNLWPVSQLSKRPIASVLESEGYKNFNCGLPAGTCTLCRDLLKKSVAKRVCNSVGGAFHGLCLDCMRKSQRGDPDAAYWKYDQRKQWGSCCRVFHTQPSWYFSYMGSTEFMREYQDNKKEEREWRAGGSGWGF